MLGIDLLWKMDLELDLAHLKLNLYEPSRCSGQVVYWASQYEVVPLLRDAFGDFYFPMELDGRKLEAMLSTERSVSTLSTDVTKRVYGFDKDSPGVESETDESGKTIAQYRAMRLTAAGLSVTDEKVRLTDPPTEGYCTAYRKCARRRSGYTSSSPFGWRDKRISLTPESNFWSRPMLSVTRGCFEALQSGEYITQFTGREPLGFSYVDLADVTVCRRLHHGVEQHHSAIEADLRVCCNPTPGH
jgi:hypothetical protein